MAIATTGPKSELGQVGTGGVLPWGAFIDEQEYVPELQWPTSIRTFTHMRNDAQVQGLLNGCTLPIRRYRWFIKKNGARPEVVKHIANSLNLPVEGEQDKPRGRRQGRFSHDRHLFHALLALVYGHNFFEQVGEIGPDGLWHLKKLGPRMPFTISEIRTAKDGGLDGITQLNTLGNAIGAPQIPVSRLVAYVWEQEAGNWTGRSMLRACYRNWLIKDRLLRVDAMKHERNGMGVPIIEAPADASGPELAAYNEMAQQYKTGEHAGGAVPHGARLRLVGTEGSLPDTVASIRLHNEEMARSFLMMFMQLGQTETGSRALGAEFIDWFDLALETVAGWYADTTNEHQIEDEVDWNWGEEEQPPMLAYDKSESSLSTTDLTALIDAGAIVVDDELEAAIRQRHKLPAKPEPDPDAPAPPAPPVPPAEPPSPEPPAPSAGVERQQRAVGASPPSPALLPDRPLRRQPYDHEITAAVDYQGMDAHFQGEGDILFQEVRQLQQGQIDQLHDSIVEANGSLKKIGKINVEPEAAEVIAGHLSGMAERGAAQVAGEAERQRANFTPPNLDNAHVRLARRAELVDLVITDELVSAAKQKAASLTGGSLAPADVANEVSSYLKGLKGSRVRDQLNGALMQGQNTGRKVAIGQNDPKNIYASELLDGSTCANCIAKDGTEYQDLGAAEADYPTGGYMSCAGGDRCRGTLVAVFDEAEPTVTDVPTIGNIPDA